MTEVNRGRNNIPESDFYDQCVYESPFGSWFGAPVGLPIPLQIEEMKWIKESMISSFSKDKPILVNPCPVDKFTQREEVKKTIRELNQQYPTFKENLFRALVHEERQNLIKKPKD